MIEAPARGGAPRWLAELTAPLLGLGFVLAGATAYLASVGELDNFLTLRNLQLLLHNSSVAGIVALGMLLVIVSGGIDLSVGSVVALVTVVAMQAYNAAYTPETGTLLPSLWAVLVGVLVGVACGLFNGLTVTRLGVTPFLATLGMLGIARGLAYWLSGKTRIVFAGDVPGWVRSLGRAVRNDWLLFDPGVWAFLLLAGLVAVLLRYTVFGRYCYAIGSNEATARLCGINVGRTKLGIYALAGLLTGLAGVLRLAHTASGDPTTGEGLELEVIAAVVLGGASLAGGQGTVAGTLMGVLILGLLVNVVSFARVPIEVKYILIGAVVIANTALGQWQRRRGE